jgi:hypothetical protein
MSTAHLPATNPLHQAAARLFAEKPPVLVEVRFPNMAVSPDWFLCDDEAELDAIFGRLGEGAEMHLHSVWDLKSLRDEIVLKK